MLKPEWAIGWLLSFLDKKLEAGKANKIQNSLGLFMYRVATRLFKNKPDTPTINTSLEEIEKQIKKFKNENTKNTQKSIFKNCNIIFSILIHCVM